MREEVEVLKYHTDFPPDLVSRGAIVGQLDTVDDDAPLLMRLQAVDAADQRRLAGA